MIKRQISFLFEDPGFCIDVFCTIAEPVRYYNRDTESGAWYSSTPDWNENGSLIREDLIFEVIADGVVCALDGNGNFEGKKPFVPFCQFRQSRICCDSQNIVKRYFRNNKKWSGRRDSNSRPSPWQGDALPLSHFRIMLVEESGFEPL